MVQKKSSAKTDKVKPPKEGGKSLVIVESPAKAKTIKKILGDSFQIKASVGHIRDLPKNALGVNVKNNFEPQYQIMPEKLKVVKELSELALKSDYVYLAPDPDREGEAIAWHISNILESFPKDKIFRIEFNEITKTAILEAIKHPRDIDIQRVNAQQARRVLDRLVGYKISPLLWSKVQPGLSAGRVQSVAVRIICDREAEIDIFIPEEYWSIHADLSKHKSSLVFQAELVRIKEDKIQIKNVEESNKIVEFLNDETTKYIVSKVSTRKGTRNPNPPFITSTLQREASNKFGYSVKKTMQIAQQLYEGVELGSAGHTGLITYMRTDSTRVSDEAAEAAQEFIVNRFGKEYYPSKRRVYEKKGKNVQDAHEAIRPSYVEKNPESIKEFLNKDQYRIYKLIWDRFIASQMESASLNTISNEISAGDYVFRASHTKIIFKGFLIVYQDFEQEEQDQVDSANIPELKKGDELILKKLLPKQHFTQPPPRYTEASLVKTLEEKGIGRPSTYAPIISTIQDRGYVVKEDKSLKPTDLGKLVNGIMLEHFNNIVDTGFTADLEESLDKVEENTENWKDVLGNFYNPFKETLKEAKEKMTKVKIVSDVQCPLCSALMVVKVSRWGDKFLACPNYPECKKTLPLSKDNKVIEPNKPSEEVCEKCNTQMIIKHGPYGEYLLCPNEECKNRKRIEKKVGVLCPDCGGNIVEKKSKRGKIFYGCDKYPKCNFATWHIPTGDKCPECSSPLVKKFLKKGNKVVCSKKECNHEELLENVEAAT